MSEPGRFRVWGQCHCGVVIDREVEHYHSSGGLLYERERRVGAYEVGTRTPHVCAGATVAPAAPRLLRPRRAPTPLPMQPPATMLDATVDL